MCKDQTWQLLLLILQIKDCLARKTRRKVLFLIIQDVQRIFLTSITQARWEPSETTTRVKDETGTLDCVHDSSPLEGHGTEQNQANQHQSWCCYIARARWLGTRSQFSSTHELLVLLAGFDLGHHLDMQFEPILAILALGTAEVACTGYVEAHLVEPTGVHPDWVAEIAGLEFFAAP